MPKVKIHTKEDLQKMKKRKFWNLFYLIAWFISVPLVFLLLPEAWNLLLRITASVALTITALFLFLYWIKNDDYWLLRFIAELFQ